MKTPIVIGLLAGLVGLAGCGDQQKTAAATADVIVYKSPSCGCCTDWVGHLRANGFSVEVRDRQDISSIKKEFGVPLQLRSCHTAKVGGYIVEGHVPAREIARLLKEKPRIDGLTVPGMPMGAPGMEGPRKDAYAVLAFEGSGRTTVFASY